MISDLFKVIILLLIAIVGLQIFLLEIMFIQSFVSPVFTLWLISRNRLEVTTLLPIASAVEIALVWLLVLLNGISPRHGLIATLILFILVGITLLIIYSYSFNLRWS